MATSYGNPPIVTDGLVLCLDAANPLSYPGSGTAWNDLSGQGNSGTLINGPTFNPSNGGSIVFDGVDDYTSINQTIGNSLLNGCTFSVWLYQNNSNMGGLVVNFDNQQSNPNRKGFVLRASNVVDFIYLSLGSDIIGRKFTTFNGVNLWSNVVGTFNGSISNNGFSIYVNGVSVDNTDLSQGTIFSIENGGTNLEFGRERYAAGPTSYLNGDIATTQIYNRALSAQEVLQNYEATKTRFGL
jgi:hypothetical protein